LTTRALSVSVMCDSLTAAPCTTEIYAPLCGVPKSP
jgi:hypothetical protein